MESTESSIAPKRMKSFVRHLCVIAKQHQDKEKARVEMKQQMEKLKRFTSKKKEMDEELQELDRKVSEVLEKEKSVLGLQRAGSSSSDHLMKKTMENREMINDMRNSLSQIKDKMDSYIEAKTRRQRKINALEQKIRSKVNAKKKTSLLRDRLGELETLYNKLKRSGADVSRVEDRIEDLKLRLIV